MGLLIRDERSWHSFEKANFWMEEVVHYYFGSARLVRAGKLSWSLGRASGLLHHGEDNFLRSVELHAYNAASSTYVNTRVYAYAAATHSM